MRYMVECTPIKVLQLFCWPWPPFVIGLPYDYPHPSGSREFAYKNFGYYAMANNVIYWPLLSNQSFYSFKAVPFQN